MAMDQEVGVSALTMGDLIGYMSWNNLPGGSPHRFDLRGEKEGYIAIIEMQDMKTMQKRDPALVVLR
jgi:hypothetical protein